MTSIDDNSRRRASGDGSVFFDRQRGCWVAVLDLGRGPGGQRRRSKRLAATQKEAAKLLRAMQRSHAQQQDLTGGKRTVAELVTTWRTEVAPLTQSAKTQSVTEGLCRIHVIPALGSLRIAEVTPDHVESAIQRWISDGLSRSTILKCRNILTATFRFAESRRIISWNPAKLANLPPTSATRAPKETTVLNAEQFVSIVAAAEGSRLQLFITLLGTYGFRPGELAGLRWENVDLDNGTVHIVESLHWTPKGPEFGPPKTARALRPVQLDPVDVAALVEHRRLQAIERDYCGDWPAEWTGLVFPTSSGKPLDDHNLRRDVKSLGRRIGVNGLTPYGLRGTATSIAADAGVAIEDLADLLGHGDTTMVMRHYRKRLRPAYNAGVTVARLREQGSQT